MADRAYVRFNKYGIYGINKISQKNTVNIEITDANFDSSKDVTVTTHIDIDSPAIELSAYTVDFQSVTNKNVTLYNSGISDLYSSCYGIFLFRDSNGNAVQPIPTDPNVLLNTSNIIGTAEVPEDKTPKVLNTCLPNRSHSYKIGDTQTTVNYTSNDYYNSEMPDCIVSQVLTSTDTTNLPVGSFICIQRSDLKFALNIAISFSITSELVANLSFECNTALANNCSAKMSITRVDTQSTPLLYEEVPIWSQDKLLPKAIFTDMPFTEEQLITAISKVISAGDILSIGHTTWYDLDDNVITNYDSYGITDDTIELSNANFTERLKIFVHNFKPYIELSMIGSTTTNIALEFDGIESSAIDSWTITQNGNELSSTTILDYSSHVPTNLNSLPEIMANSSFALTWKGLRFNDNNGRPLLFANAETGDLSVNKITATEGEIAGWSINENYLGYGGNVGSEKSMYLSPIGVNGDISFGGITVTKDWKIAIGTNFFVSADGTLYAKNANIEGDIAANAISVTNFTANSSGVRIANFKVDGTSIYYSPNNSTDFGIPNSVMMCSGSGTVKSIAGSPEIGGWAFTAGENFGVTNTGAFYTKYNGPLQSVTFTNDPSSLYFLHAGNYAGTSSVTIGTDGTLTCKGATISGTISAASFNTISAPSSGASFCGWNFYNTAFGTINYNNLMAFSVEDVGKPGSRCVGIGPIIGDNVSITGAWGTGLNFAIYGDGKVFCDAIISGEHSRTNNNIECRGQTFFGDLEKVCDSPAVSLDSQMRRILNELKNYVFGTAESIPSGRFAPCGLITISTETNAAQFTSAASLINAFGIFTVNFNATVGEYTYHYKNWNS